MENQEERRSQYRKAILAEAKRALDELKRNLDQPNGSRVAGVVAIGGDPQTLRIKVEVPIGQSWVVLVEIDPIGIGMTENDIAQEVKLLRYQAGIGIPDDLSGINGPDNDAK